MAGVAKSLSSRLAWVSLRAVCRAAMSGVDLRVEGLEHLPASGPAIIAARHYHHFYDGAALLTIAPRPLRVLVTLDWAVAPILHRAMDAACQAAGWPVVPRDSRLSPSAPGRALREATRQSVALLRAGRMLLVFPEGYPTIDPGFTPKTRDDEVLPFQPGFLRFAALTERDGKTLVPIVPAGLEYARGARWGLNVRFGAPMNLDPNRSIAAQAGDVEEWVRRLSGLPARPAATA